MERDASCNDEPLNSRSAWFILIITQPVTLFKETTIRKASVFVRSCNLISQSSYLVALVATVSTGGRQATSLPVCLTAQMSAADKSKKRNFFVSGLLLLPIHTESWLPIVWWRQRNSHYFFPSLQEIDVLSWCKENDYKDIACTYKTEVINI